MYLFDFLQQRGRCLSRKLALGVDELHTQTVDRGGVTAIERFGSDQLAPPDFAPHLGIQRSDGKGEGVSVTQVQRTWALNPQSPLADVDDPSRNRILQVETDGRIAQVTTLVGRAVESVMCVGRLLESCHQTSRDVT